MGKIDLKPQDPSKVLGGLVEAFFALAIAISALGIVIRPSTRLCDYRS